MKERHTLKGWKMLFSAALLGPVALVLYFEEARKTFPAARYFGWLALLVMVVCGTAMFTFMASPGILRILYGVIYLALFGLAFFYCWGLNAKAKDGIPRTKQGLALSRALAWMSVMAIFFMGVNNIIQGVYFWLFGEWVVVFFGKGANFAVIWLPIGLCFGFFYGLRKDNHYIDRDFKSVVRFMVHTFVFIALFNAVILSLAVYPLQRLVPIAYFPQTAEYFFYGLLFLAICFSTFHLFRAASSGGFLKAGLIMLAGAPLIALHVVVVSAYTVTINLAAASILEDRQRIDAAKAIYAKAIPYIRYDHLLAALHHRQGVLHVMKQDYPAAAESFKKVLTDYSENYEVYAKAKRYMEAFEKKTPQTTPGGTILKVHHRTFEQAASCFPNSLSVILNFYGDLPVSTRNLSYAIKESFSSGTFIWKAESFLEQNGFALVTTYWQTRETLISLLESGYPVLVYVPGHVYTLYGYDRRMDMFFTYDTAKANRWDDKPFWTFQRTWMQTSFLMSVVVPKAELEKFNARYPGMVRYSRSYQLWQKAHISDYYERKDNYWKDYNRHAMSAEFGLDRFKINERYFQHPGITPYPWDAEDWYREVAPILNQPWALEWSIVRNYLTYLIYHGQTEPARQVVRQVFANMGKEGQYYYPDLLNLILAAEIRSPVRANVLSISDKLIGVTGNSDVGSYWGHYFKARHLISMGELKAAADLLLMALEHMDVEKYWMGPSLTLIVKTLDELQQRDPSVIAEDKRPLVKFARIHYAIGR